MNELLFSVSSEFMHMLVRFIICVAVNWVIVDLLYYKKSKRRDFFFTFMLIGVAIFFIVFFMIFVLEDMKGKTGIGVGIGMFGIFSIMRYRTDAMPVREMTYLFIILCLSVVNALASTMPLAELLITNMLIVVVVWLCESLLKVVPYKLIQYDRIELTKPERHDDLIADIRERTGLDVINVEVGGIDMLRDMAVIKVFYNSHDNTVSNSVDEKMKLKTTEFTEN
ncbi:MAG: DUF4956 domain-containing protein [Prevotella sp.]|jgi:hypothetical protein|nr:DUF4956 domain-containing protein [Prevotella sp.]